MSYGANGPPLLQIEDLTVGYRTGTGWLDAVRGVCLEVRARESYGIVGESGSGKTTLALAVLGYLPPAGRVRSGSVRFKGRELLGLSDAERRRLWGAEMALVPQEPAAALNPAMRIGEQVAEVLRHHQGLDRAAAWRRTLELLAMVQIADPERVARAYPHQASGGMQQRVLIAMALSTEPSLLVLDEPTTGLDTTTQAAVLDLVHELMRERQTAVLHVTHSLGVVAQTCARVAVLYAGELVEDGPTTDLLRRPLHPYTRGLLDSVPRLGQSKREVRLRPIEGRIPPLNSLPSGCIFAPRCPLAIPACQEHPPLSAVGPARHVRCHRWEEIAARRVDPSQPEPSPPARQQAPSLERAEPVLRVEGLRVYYAGHRTVWDVVRRRRAPSVKAVDGVDLDLWPAGTVGLVGESGSGKTTLGRAVLGLVEWTDGRMEMLGLPLPPVLGRRTLETLRRIQTVSQNPDEALNPYLTVGEAVRRPLERLLGLPRRRARQEAVRLLEAVHLPADFMHRLPGQLSGGEKQRVAIARALASDPSLLVADEPISSLDVSVQASILNLLNELHQDRAYLFISHDLAVVGYLADTVAVIYLGRLVEVASAQDVFEPPYHPYTEALLSAIPLIDPAAQQERIRLKGEVPSPAGVPSGCPFHTRCPRFLGDVCVRESPPWRVAPSGKRYACHIPAAELGAQQKRVFTFSEAEEVP